MYTSYVLKNDKGLVSFYTQNNILYRRNFYKNKWSNAQVIQTGVKPYFSLNTVDKDNNIVMFIHSVKNQIHFIYFEEKGEFKSRPILESNNLSSNPYFFCMLEENIFTIIYAYQTDRNKYNIAKMQLVNGNWTDSEVIDTAYSPNNIPFFVQKIAENHYMIFYDTFENSLNLGYREISTHVISDRVTYHSTLYNLIDKSFLVTNTSIYNAFTLKSMFSCQLLFRQKTKYGYNNVKVIAEGQKIKNLSMFVYDDNIYVTYTLGNDVYFVHGQEGDDIQFSKPQKLSKKLPVNDYVKKACVISNDKKYNQLVVAENLPFQPIFVTEINPFFQNTPFTSISSKEGQKEEKNINVYNNEARKKIDNSKKQINPISQKESSNINNEMSSTASVIKQLSVLKTELYMKNEEIEKLENYINTLKIENAKLIEQSKLLESYSHQEIFDDEGEDIKKVTV